MVVRFQPDGVDAGLPVNLNRRIYTTIVLALPLVLLLGWFVTEQAPRWLPTVPGWLRPASGEAATGACEALAAVEAYDGSFINFFQQSALHMDDARARARQHAEAAYGVTLPDDASLSPATRVTATFPGVGERLVWLAIATLPKAPDDRFDHVGVLFVDAETGDLLALNTATSVVDAATACGGGPVGRRALVRQYLPLLLAGAYVGVVGVGLLGWRLFKRVGRSG
jgi:hypothetical protein